MKLVEYKTEIIRNMLDIALYDDNITAFKLILAVSYKIQDNTDLSSIVIQKQMTKRHRWVLSAIHSSHTGGLSKLTHIWSDILLRITTIMCTYYKQTTSALTTSTSLYDYMNINPSQLSFSSVNSNYCPSEIKKWFKEHDDEYDSDSDNSSTGAPKNAASMIADFVSRDRKMRIKDKNILKNFILCQHAMVCVSNPKNIKSFLYYITQDIHSNFGTHQLQKSLNELSDEEELAACDMYLDSNNVSTVIETILKLINREINVLNLSTKALDMLPAKQKYKELYEDNIINDVHDPNNVILSIHASYKYDPLAEIDLNRVIDGIYHRCVDLMLVGLPLVQCDLPNKFRQSVLKLYTNLYKLISKIDSIVLKHGIYPSPKYEKDAKKIIRKIFEPLQTLIDLLHHDEIINDQDRKNNEINTKNIKTMNKQSKEITELTYYMAEHDRILNKIADNKKMPSLLQGIAPLKVRGFKSNVNKNYVNNGSQKKSQTQSDNDDDDGNDKSDGGGASNQENNDDDDDDDDGDNNDEEKDITLDDDADITTMGGCVTNDNDKQHKKHQVSGRKRKRNQLNDDNHSKKKRRDGFSPSDGINNLSISQQDNKEPPRKKRRKNIQHTNQYQNDDDDDDDDEDEDDDDVVMVDKKNKKSKKNKKKTKKHIKKEKIKKHLRNKDKKRKKDKDKHNKKKKNKHSKKHKNKDSSDESEGIEESDSGDVDDAYGSNNESDKENKSKKKSSRRNRMHRAVALKSPTRTPRKEKKKTKGRKKKKNVFKPPLKDN